MPSAFDDRISSESSQRHSLGSTPPPVAKRVDLNQMFTLIDGILPFEACLYYQVLPLSIEGSRLNLGMVDPDDRGAADYVRRMLSYINCSIVSCQIPSDWHRRILSQYLSHTAKAKQQTQLTEKTSGNQPNPSIDNVSQEKMRYSPTVEAPKAPDPSVEANDSSVEENAPEANRAPDTLTKAQKTNTEYDLDQQNFRPTLVVDTPDQLSSLEENVAQPNRPTAPKNDTNETVNADSSKQLEKNPQGSNHPPLHLQVDSQAQFRSIDELATLTHKEIMHELLKRVIVVGIGRLYFERQADRGRILWSKDGVLQSVLDNLQPSAFQGVINELKLLTHLPIASDKPKQAEIERLYQGKRVLLRFRTMSGKHGEEATLQVLRGAALKFYQQQQIDKLSHNALGSAQKLQQQINQIREKGRQNLNLSGIHVETLPAIFKLLKQIETQVQEIILEHPEQTPQQDEDSED